FVGREPELARFAQALRGEPGAGTVFYIYGPGGVGKSALLRQYAGLAVAAGREVLWLDGRSMGASPREFLGALAEARPPGTRDPGDLGGSVLFIDTYELITPLDWTIGSGTHSCPSCRRAPWWSSPGAPRRLRVGEPTWPGETYCRSWRCGISVLKKGGACCRRWGCPGPNTMPRCR